MASSDGAGAAPLLDELSGLYSVTPGCRAALLPSASEGLQSKARRCARVPRGALAPNCSAWRWTAGRDRWAVARDARAAPRPVWERGGGRRSSGVALTLHGASASAGGDSRGESHAERGAPRLCYRDRIGALLRSRDSRWRAGRRLAVCAERALGRRRRRRVRSVGRRPRRITSRAAARACAPHARRVRQRRRGPRWAAHRHDHAAACAADAAGDDDDAPAS